MASYKDPTFEERTALARQAREQALAKLAARAPLDPAVVAERKAAQEAREQAAAEKSAAKKAAAEAAAAASVVPVASEEELKAARDAKYAARKKRKG